MKCITREVKMYKYIFANIDLKTGSAYNMQEKYSSNPMGQRAIKAFCESNNAVMIHKEDIPVKYSLPLELFVKACEEYAVEVAEGRAPAITPDDEVEGEEPYEIEEDFDD